MRSFLSTRPTVNVRTPPLWRSRRLADPWLAAFAGLFLILRIDRLRGQIPHVFPDTSTYRAAKSLYPHTLSFTGHALRPWTLPLIYRILGDDHRIMKLQVALGILAWLALAAVVADRIADPVVRRGLVGLLLFLGLTQQAMVWDLDLISESLSLSLALLLVAAVHRFWLDHSRLAGATVVGLMTLLMFTRLVMFAVAVVLCGLCLGLGALHRNRVRLIVGLALVPILAWGQVANARQNDGYRVRDHLDVSYFEENLGNLLFKRYLPDPESFRWFQARGMPALAPGMHASVVADQRVQDWEPWQAFFVQFRTRPEWKGWAEKQGTGLLGKYFIAHPVKTTRWFADLWPHLDRSPWDLNYGPDLHPIGNTLFFWGAAHTPFLSDTGVLIFVALLLAWRVRRRKLVAGIPLIGLQLVTIAFALFAAFAAWFLSGYEHMRHMVPSVHLIRAALLVIIAVLADALVRHRRAGALDTHAGAEAETLPSRIAPMEVAIEP